MRPSPWSLALMMMILGVTLVFFGGQSGPPHPATWVAASALVVGGASLFFKRRVTYWLALGAGAIVLSLAVASYVLRRMLVPVPVVTGVIGLIVMARVVLARSVEERIRARREARIRERAARGEAEGGDEEPGDEEQHD